MNLEVYSDLSEKVNYNIPDFPLFASDGDIQAYDRYLQHSHWHVDLEFILILAGAMEYAVNGISHHVEEGKGLFINSKRIHHGFSADKSDCSYLVVLVHPSLLGAYTSFSEEYFSEKFGTEAEDFIMLSDENDWQREILGTIKIIYEQMQNTDKNPFHLVSLYSSMCSRVSDNIKITELPGSVKHDWKTVWEMTGFIHRNFEREISLEDIAAAGSVCRSNCCKLFSKHIGQTPKHYLTQFRISKGLDMLRDTDVSITEIASACGYNNQSHFTQAFRKEIGVTPSVFREGARRKSQKVQRREKEERAQDGFERNRAQTAG